MKKALIAIIAAVSASIAMPAVGRDVKIYKDGPVVANESFTKIGAGVKAPLELKFTLGKLENAKIGRLSGIILTPKIVTTDTTVVMKPIVVLGHDFYNVVMREVPDAFKGARIVSKAGVKGGLNYVDTCAGSYRIVSGDVVIEVARISVKTQAQLDACNFNRKTERPVTVDKFTISRAEFVPAYFRVSPSRPEATPRTVDGVITFPAGVATIDNDYRDNGATMRALAKSLKDFSDKDKMVSLNIVAHEPPVESLKAARTICDSRVTTVKNYFARYADLKNVEVTTSTVPCDWQMVKDWVKDSPIDDHDKMVSFIESSESMAPEKRLAEFKKRFPEQYSFLVDVVYPALRSVSYTVTYQAQPLEVPYLLKQAYEKDPSKLTPFEIFTYSESVRPTSIPEADKIVLKMEKLYPDDPACICGAAAVYLQHKNLSAAKALLDRAGDSSVADYYRGCYYALNHDYDKAMHYYKLAADRRLKQGADAVQALTKFLNEE